MSKNLPASVRQRLTNKAKETNRPFQELLQYFAMERFLYRLAQSPHAGKFILKGALMFTAWGGPPSRPTKDIDLLARMDNCAPLLPQILACQRTLCRQQCPRCPFKDHPAALVPALGTHINNPVRARNHVEIVLDHNHRVAALHQPVQNFQKVRNVRHVQPRRRLVQHIDAPFLVQLARQLDALAFPARQRAQRLPQRQIVQPHVEERLHFRLDRRKRKSVRRKKGTVPWGEGDSPLFFRTL